MLGDGKIGALDSLEGLYAMDDSKDPARLIDGRIMTTAEVASWLATSESTIKRQAQAREIPSSKIGAERRFWRPALQAHFWPGEAVVEPANEPADVLTPAQLAAVLQLNPVTILRRIQDGSIPASQLGTQYRIWWPSIRARLQAGEDFVPTRPLDPAASSDDVD